MVRCGTCAPGCALQPKKPHYLILSRPSGLLSASSSSQLRRISVLLFEAKAVLGTSRSACSVIVRARVGFGVLAM